MISIQDEVNEKIVSLCITGGKISTRILKHSIEKLLIKMNQGFREMQKEKEPVYYKGKQSLKQLQSQKMELSNIEITDKNIKSFERYARKYNIDYCLKKDTSSEKPKYYVFFKAKDVDVMTAAFKEYTGWQLKKKDKGSVLKKLSLAKERTAKHRERIKEKKKERNPSL